MTKEEGKGSEEDPNASGNGNAQGNEEQKEGLTDEQFAALQKDPRYQELFRKDVQIEKDKAVATIQRNQRKSQQERLADVRRSREDEELDSLVESDDMQGLGERTRDVRRQQKTLREAASMVSGEIESVLSEHPEFRAIGEDKIEEIRLDVGAKGGTVVDFAVALSREARTRDLAGVLDKAREDNQKDMEAFLVKRGLLKRSEEEGADETVSGAGGGTSSDSRTEDEILEDPNTPVPVLEKILKERGIKVK